MSDQAYLLDNQQAEAGQRFDALGSLFDPVSQRHITALGIEIGWKCWEIGAGGASMPQWLADQAGGAQVLATDIDTSWLPADASYRVLVHDVGAEPPPSGGWQLVHARLVLGHVTQRDQALRWIVESLAPGGWLLLEEADPALQPLLCPDESGEAEVLANRLRRGFRELMAARGVDLSMGRTLPRRLRELGLVDVEADAFFPITSPACTALERATVLQIKDRLIDAGIATLADIQAHLGNLDGGTMDCATAPLISAWARKPG